MEQVLKGETGGAGWHQWEGEVAEKVGRRNTVQIMCTHVCKCKK
jgi:hypothetical protein